MGISESELKKLDDKKLSLTFQKVSEIQKDKRYNIINAKRDEFRAKAFEKATEINKTKGSAEANKYYTKMNKITMDDGVFAAALGYDAINVTDAKYIVILNRSKVIVSE